MIKCRWKQQTKHQNQVCEQDSDQQHDVVAHVLEDDAQTEPPEKMNPWAQVYCPVLLFA